MIADLSNPLHTWSGSDRPWVANRSRNCFLFSGQPYPNVSALATLASIHLYDKVGGQASGMLPETVLHFRANYKERHRLVSNEIQW